MSKMAYGENGYLDFDKLWKLLEKKNLKQQYLINNGIHRNTVYKLKNNDNITSEVICNLCKLLNCQPKDILEYIPNKKDLKCIKQEKNNGEYIQNEAQATQNEESSTNDKSIKQPKIGETGADSERERLLNIQAEIEIRRTEREEFKKSNMVVQDETAKEENKPSNNLDDALTKQLNAIRERREQAKNNETDECPF